MPETLVNIRQAIMHHIQNVSIEGRHVDEMNEDSDLPLSASHGISIVGQLLVTRAEQETNQS